MKQLLAFILLLTLLLSALALPVMADGEDDAAADSVSNYQALDHVGLEFPEKFEDGEFWDFYWYDEEVGQGVHSNFFNSADGLSAFEYVYLKAYEGEDKSTAFPAEEAYISIPFEVEETGTYDFLIEVMAFETAIPRTGLLQVDDGEKFYLSATHGTNHEVWEYFTGMSAYLTAGEHTMTVYLAPDFDDASVKSLFFDNFYVLLNEDAEAPNPAPPAWDEDKSIVLQQSFDELRRNGEGSQGIFAPGASASWDKVAAIDTSVTELNYWGWVALSGDVGVFGYQIDHQDPLYDPLFAAETEQAVLDAATSLGAASASGMLINISVADLVGEHTVHVLYKDEDGNAVTLCTFTIDRKETATPSETDPSESKPAEDPDESLPEDSAPAATTPDKTPADTTADTTAPAGGCASSTMALSVVMVSFAAAYVLRRKD